MSECCVPLISLNPCPFSLLPTVFSMLWTLSITKFDDRREIACRPDGKTRVSVQNDRCYSLNILLFIIIIIIIIYILAESYPSENTQIPLYIFLVENIKIRNRNKLAAIAGHASLQGDAMDLSIVSSCFQAANEKYSVWSPRKERLSDIWYLQWYY